MTFLYEKYPETVTVAGEEYPILTDFRNWIKFADLIADTEVEDEEKAELLLCWFKDRVPDDLQAALDALADFYVMESDAGETEGEEEQKPLFFLFQPMQIISLPHIRNATESH